MKAIVYHDYGPPEVLRYEEIEKPSPGKNEVLIKVCAASVNPLDAGVMQGLPYVARLLLGLPKGRNMRIGVDVAGRVEAVGKNVTRFNAGDEVFGLCIRHPKSSGVKAWIATNGAFAEYVCAAESMLAQKPQGVTFEQAAAVPVAGLSALQGLRDKACVQPGQRVLINGAAGGVGTFAVQIAKAFDADVTGVCSTRSLELVRSIGADSVIDYTQEDFTRNGRRYDVIFDCVGNRPFTACRRVLHPNGKQISVAPPRGHNMSEMMGSFIAVLVSSRFASQKLITFVAKPSQDDLVTMCELMKTAKVKPVIDTCYRLMEAPEAVRHLGQGHVRGKVIIVLVGVN